MVVDVWFTFLMERDVNIFFSAVATTWDWMCYFASPRSLLKLTQYHAWCQHCKIVYLFLLSVAVASNMEAEK